MSRASRCTGSDVESGSDELALVLCKCGMSGKVWTSHTKDNPGRRFVGCRNYKKDKPEASCGMFCWVDEESVRRVNRMLTDLRGLNEVLRTRTDRSVERDELIGEIVSDYKETKAKLKDAKRELKALKAELVQIRDREKKYLLLLGMVITIFCVVFSSAVGVV